MSKKEIIFFIILFILLAIGKVYAMNIGAAQPSGTNIGVGQYEATATTTYYLGKSIGVGIGRGMF